MVIRSMILALAVGSAAGCVAEGDAVEQTATTEQRTGNFDCSQGVVGLINVVNCDGTLLSLPIDIEIKDVDVLSNNDIDILEDSLNDLSILNGSPINILNGVKVEVLNELVDKLDVDSEVTVCTVLGLLHLCA